MSEEEFLMYQAKKRAVWEQRGKYGTDFYIPYFTKNIAEEQNERTEEIYYKS
uniref:Site-specific DNA-methyltransferase n=1 Tax=Meloidogyne hapla TaxID=6305 RepID=A0A1I8BEP7_MELHA